MISKKTVLSKKEKKVELILLIIIFLSVLLMMLESVQAINEKFSTLFIILEWTFTSIFTIEYLVRIKIAKNPKKYMTSFIGIIDILAILPTFVGFFISMGVASNLLVIRCIRLIRIFKILQLDYFLDGANQIGNGLWGSRHKIIVFFATMVCATTIMGTIMYAIEGPENGFSSIPQSIYWAMVTITTVGYGDITPQTPIGQGLAACLMVMGYAIIAVPTGIVSAEMSKSSLHMDKCEFCGTHITLEDAKYCHICGAKINNK